VVRVGAGAFSDGFPPTARNGAAACWDPVRDRMLVVGGSDGSYRIDVATLSSAAVPRWGEVAVVGALPPGRHRHSVVYDSARDRIVVFGGRDGGERSDVWMLPLSESSEWNEITTTGPGPVARSEHSAVYDAVHDRMIIFGGWDGTSLRNDVWALAFDGEPQWVELSPSGTPPNTRRSCGTAYDSLRNRMILFGGGSSAGYKNDVWALTLGVAPAWERLLPSGTAPAIRQGATASYDSASDALIVFGGYNGTYFGDAWSMSLGGGPVWTSLAPSGAPPAGRTAHVAVYDAANERVLVFGGSEGGDAYVSETWVLDLSATPTWSNPVVAPADRLEHTAVYDHLERKMIVYGGIGDSGMIADLWALTMDGTSAWDELELWYASLVPAPRFGHSALWDPSLGLMYVYGGLGDRYGEGDALDEEWRLGHDAEEYWWQRHTPQPPAGRYGQAAAWDFARKRMMIFGGARAGFNSLPLNDVWEATPGEDWTPIVPAGTRPPAGAGSAAIYDPMRGRMLVFNSGTWALTLSDLPEWTQLSPGGDSPPSFVNWTAIHDPVRDRAVLCGGNPLQCWALYLAGPFWRQLSPSGYPPTGRIEHSAIYDPINDRMIIFGGRTTGTSVSARGDVWELRWEYTTDARDPVATGTPSLRATPNPAHGPMTFRISLPAPSAFALRIFDVQGAEVRCVRGGSAATAVRDVVWDGRDERGRRVPAGVYIGSLETAGTRVTQKFVVLR